MFFTIVNVNSTVMVVEESLTNFRTSFPKKQHTQVTCFKITCTFEVYSEVISGMTLTSIKSTKKIVKWEFRLQNTND